MNRPTVATPEINLSNLTTKQSSFGRRRGSLTRSMPEAPRKMSIPSVIFVPIEALPLSRWSPEGSCSDDCNLMKICSCDEDTKEPQSLSVYNQCPAVSMSSSTGSVATREELGDYSCTDLSTHRTVATRRMSQDSKSCQRSIERRTRQVAPPSLPRRQRSSAGLEL